MDLEETGINAGNWFDSAKDKNYWRGLVNAALNLRDPLPMELVSQWIKPGLNRLYYLIVLVFGKENDSIIKRVFSLLLVSKKYDLECVVILRYIYFLLHHCEKHN